MPVDKSIDVSLAQAKPLAEWKPQIGDFVYYNGFFSKWVGVVNNVGRRVSIIEGGNPFLLLNYSQAEMVKHTIHINIEDLKRGTRGKYAVMRSELNTLIWYI